MCSVGLQLFCWICTTLTILELEVRSWALVPGGSIYLVVVGLGRSIKCTVS